MKDTLKMKKRVRENWIWLCQQSSAQIKSTIITISINYTLIQINFSNSPSLKKMLLTIAILRNKGSDFTQNKQAHHHSNLIWYFWTNWDGWIKLPRWVNSVASHHIYVSSTQWHGLVNQVWCVVILIGIYEFMWVHINIM